MARVPFFDRLPQIWRRLDQPDNWIALEARRLDPELPEPEPGILQRFLKVLDTEFDGNRDKIESLLQMHSPDTIPDKYIRLLSEIVGHVWRDDKTRLWNRRRISHAIHRHSYKGTLDRLDDTVLYSGGTQHAVGDQASKLLIFGTQGRWGYDDCAFVAADYWHEGAFLLDVDDGVDFDDMMDELSETLMGGEVWYARSLDQYGMLSGGWFNMSDETMTMDEVYITMGDERLILSQYTPGYPSVSEIPIFDGGVPLSTYFEAILDGGDPTSSEIDRTLDGGSV